MALPQLRAIRTDRGFTQKALAHAAGVSETTIARIEQGKQEPSLVTLVMLADCLGVTTDALFGRAPANDKALTDASPASPVRA